METRIFRTEVLAGRYNIETKEHWNLQECSLPKNLAFFCTFCQVVQRIFLPDFAPTVPQWSMFFAPSLREALVARHGLEAKMPVILGETILFGRFIKARDADKMLLFLVKQNNTKWLPVPTTSLHEAPQLQSWSSNVGAPTINHVESG